MDEEETYVEVSIEPRLHDRWSLLSLTAAFVADMAQTVADNLASAAVMSVEHAKQKQFDQKFKEVSRDYTSTRRRSGLL